jgi:hypothetical protein
MSTIDWELLFSPEPEQRTKQVFRCALHCVTDRDRLPIIEEMPLSDFEARIDALLHRLAMIKAEAREQWDALPQEEQAAAVLTTENNPDHVWKLLKDCQTNSEMQELFNGLPDQVRRKTAEYVLSTVNIFAGAGAFFAQNYDHSTAMLE